MSSAEAKSVGRIETTLMRWFLRHSRISAVESVAGSFRLITLTSDSLKGFSFKPGLRIQISVGGIHAMRTYTPVMWDVEGGTVSILVYLHGIGPGANWAGHAEPGDEVWLFGPRQSLDISQAVDPFVFGDETSFGLALAIQASSIEQTGRRVFEVSDAVAARDAVQHFGIRDVTLFTRLPDDGHLPSVVEAMQALCLDDRQAFLTGRAAAVQHLYKAIRQSETTPPMLRAKAYWASGKVGLE